MPGIRLWLDDERPAPDGWVHARTAYEAIEFLLAGDVSEVSLDHDLGPPDAGDGYQVACAIEQFAVLGRLSRLAWRLHTANPVGRGRMEAALQGAERAWGRAGSLVARVVVISGLRDVDPASTSIVEDAVREVFAQYAPDELRFGGARGVDTLALLAARAVGVRRRVVYCPGTVADLPIEARAAIGAATEVIELGAAPLGKVAFFARNRAMLVGADRLIAFTDGRIGGGTAHALTTARKLGLPVTVVRIGAVPR